VEQDGEAGARVRYYHLVAHFHCFEAGSIELQIREIRRLSPFWGMKARIKYKAWIEKQQRWRDFWDDQRRRRTEAKARIPRFYDQGGPPVEQEERKLVTTVNAAPPADAKTVSGHDAERRPKEAQERQEGP
jgi:hypothetical protein